MTDENRNDYGEELYNLLAQFLNRPSNREFLDSIRGEYGVLWTLATCEAPVSAGTLKDKLHVVPGRMTDILTALEAKGLIKRVKDARDRRIVIVSLTEEGRREAEVRRNQIHEKYGGLFDAIGPEDAKELIRLLKIMLTYS